MSMKYYAVTDDPNELLHYGVKGMKWGQHLFGDDLRPKSAGYKRARSKLRKLKSDAKKAVSSAKVSIKVSRQQAAANRQRKREEKQNRAVMKAQQRVNAIEGLSALNKMQNYEAHVKNDYNASRNANRLALRNERKYARNEKRMDKYTQLAREGRLKYGKLSDDQVNRITERLAIEAQTRRLGSTENPKFRIRAKQALQEGMLQGITQGTAAGMKEVAVAKVQNRLRNKYTLDKQNRIDAERQKEAARIKNRKSHREMKQDIRDKTYQEGLEYGANIFGRTAITAKGAARKRNAIQNKLAEQKRIQTIQAKLANERDESFGKTYLEEKGYTSDKDAFKAHKKKLNAAADQAALDYGWHSDQHIAAMRKANDFDGLDSASKKRIMNADAVKEKEAKEKAKKAEEKAEQKREKAEEKAEQKKEKLEEEARRRLEKQEDDAERRKEKAEDEARRKQEKQEENRFKMASEAFKVKMKLYNEKLAQHKKDIAKVEKDIENTEKQKSNMSDAKYNSRMSDLEKILKDLRDNPPEEPDFEDFFRS